MRFLKKYSLKYLLAAAIVVNASEAFAEVICQPADQDYAFHAVIWDLETGEASLKFHRNGIDDGQIVYTRRFDSSGDAINILIELEPREHFPRDRIEILAWPKAMSSQYYIAAVEFVTVDGERRVDIVYPATAYRCIEI